MSSNGVRVADGSTTTGDHCPDASCGVQDSEFEGSTSGAVELLDVSLFLQSSHDQRGRARAIRWSEQVYRRKRSLGLTIEDHGRQRRAYPWWSSLGNRLRKEGLEDEVVESAGDCLDLETERYLALWRLD